MVFIKEDAKIMADLLKTGHKMLNLSCPLCNNPIFQKKNGTAFCAICKREVLLIDTLENKNNENKKPILINKTEIENLKSKFLPVLIDKLHWIAQKLEKESHLSVISDYLEMTLKLLNLVEKFNNLNLN